MSERGEAPVAAAAAVGVGSEMPAKKQKLSSDENSNPGDLSGDENVRPGGGRGGGRRWGLWAAVRGEGRGGEAGARPAAAGPRAGGARRR